MHTTTACNGKEFCLAMGPLSPPINQQLDDQGLAFVFVDDVIIIQKDADAITRCVLNGFIPEAVGRKARQKLVDRVANLVRIRFPSQNQEAS